MHAIPTLQGADVMGVFCDGCYILCGSINGEHCLKPYDRYDLCPDCYKKAQDVTLNGLTKIKKGNIIRGRRDKFDS